MSKTTLNDKEMLFCRLYCATRNPREAAARSGYKLFPEKAGNKLLARKDIADTVNALNEASQGVGGDAVAGLKRLALSGISDPLRLIYAEEPLSREELEGLDLFMVSEIKRPKGGGMEIKFFDRIKALERLSELEGISDNNRMAPFYNALTEGVRRLNGANND